MNLHFILGLIFVLPFIIFSFPNPIVKSQLQLKHIYHHGYRNDDHYLLRTELKSNTKRFEINFEKFDPKDKQTILSMAEISYNTYENRNTSHEWKSIYGYNVTGDFGWENDGMRGYIYATDNFEIIILAVKGTSLKFLDIEGPTSDKDQQMDNLMFSCCCARVNSRWETVCDCYRGLTYVVSPDKTDNICYKECLSYTMQNSLSYFKHAESIYLQLKKDYPRSTIYTTGHSLGASVVSILSYKYNLTAICFESPGEFLYASRLGLIDNNHIKTSKIYHYGNDADPIFIGSCNGPLSTCSISGYAMETKCHIGNVCTYELNLPTSVTFHTLSYVINNVIKTMNVPNCKEQIDCVDCDNWNFI
jgi:lipase ATG15